VTVWTDNAEAFATRDRDVVADQLLTNAVREVVAAYQLAHRAEHAGQGDYHHGLVDAATHTLNRAGESAERILGRAAA
jgi:hypothetical protein